MGYDLVTVGHIVLDFIKSGGKTEGPQIGGPCAYSSLAAHSIGARVGVVSKVGQDFGEPWISWLRKSGVSVANVRVTGSDTTVFQITYVDGRRRMKVLSICDSFGKDDFSNMPSSRALHIGPVLQEIPITLATELAARDSMVALDPQGYFRRLGADGTVRLRKWKGNKLLGRVDVLKISESELPAILDGSPTRRNLSKLRANIVLLTRGAEGTVVWSRDHGAFNLPAFSVPVRNPTGAGDALLGAFLVTLIRTSDLLWSASVGGASASFLIESGRPARFGARKQIEKRATAILDQTTKL